MNTANKYQCRHKFQSEAKKQPSIISHIVNSHEKKWKRFVVAGSVLINCLTLIFHFGLFGSHYVVYLLKALVTGISFTVAALALLNQALSSYKTTKSHDQNKTAYYASHQQPISGIEIASLANLVNNKQQLTNVVNVSELQHSIFDNELTNIAEQNSMTKKN